MKINFKKYLIIAALSLFAIQAASTVAATAANDSGLMICSDLDEIREISFKV